MNQVLAVTNSAGTRLEGVRLALVHAVRAGSPWPVAAIWLAMCLLIVTVNAVSVSSDFAARGLGLAGWKPWVWEYSSFVGMAAVFWPTGWAQTRLAHARSTAPFRLAAGLLLVLPFSAGHIAAMVAIRTLVYAILGERYRFGGAGLGVIYEFRKDLVAFLLLSGFLALWRVLGISDRASDRLSDRPLAPAAVAAPGEPSFLVPGRHGATLVRAGQIDWVEAQGNYVALHAGDRTHLLRQPMKQMEAALAQAQFIRTHRSALVNLAHVGGLEREDDRDWIRVGGHRAPLSETRRGAVIKALAG